MYRHHDFAQCLADDHELHRDHSITLTSISNIVFIQSLQTMQWMICYQTAHTKLLCTVQQNEWKMHPACICIRVGLTYVHAALSTCTFHGYCKSGCQAQVDTMIMLHTLDQARRTSKARLLLHVMTSDSESRLDKAYKAIIHNVSTRNENLAILPSTPQVNDKTANLLHTH